MPHSHVPLALSPSGEIGPLCHVCGKRLTFGEAMVHDELYYCWTHYQSLTGATAATSGSEVVRPFYRG